MKCEELLKALSDYVEGDIDPRICQEFEKHLAGCDPCQVVIDNIRKTITLYQGDKPYPMPPEFHDCLQATLRARWKERFPQAQS
jgi:anti-sigma factor RsiW